MTTPPTDAVEAVRQELIPLLPVGAGRLHDTQVTDICKGFIAAVLDNLPREVMARGALETTGLMWDTATAVRKAMADDWIDAAIAAAKREILGHD